MKGYDVVQVVLKECMVKVYVPPSLRGHYETEMTPYGTRIKQKK